MDGFEFMDGSLCEGEHRDVSVVLIVPSVLLDMFVELVDEVVLVLHIVRLLLVIVAPISRVQSANVVEFVYLVTMKHHDHSPFDRFVVIIQKQQKVNLVVCYWITYCSYILALCL